MCNKLLAFFLPLVFTAKALSAPAGSACDWVDQEALVALGLANSVPKVAPRETGIQGSSQCTIATPNAPTPSLIVSLQPNSNDLVLTPFCNWQSPPSTDIELGICSASVRHEFLTIVFIVSKPSTSAMKSTLSAQIERLFKKHVEASSE